MDRSQFLKLLGFGSIAAGTGLTGLEALAQSAALDGMTEKMPVLFIGHGSPQNVLFDNAYTRHLSQLGQELPKPKAILVVSAHWLTKGTYVNAASQPETVYDFGGFPPEMYQIKYPAPGSPEFAQAVQALVEKTSVGLDDDWGFDHGAWTVLKWLYPQADVPVFQMSINYHQPAAYHYALAKELAPLRQKGLLIIGSGNITHNLRMFNPSSIDAPLVDWAVEFDEKVKSFLLDQNHQPLFDYQKLGKAAQMSVPTPDHYWPLMYTIGLQEKGEVISFPFEGFQYGTFSMRSVKVG